jgi:hypothetical protein
MVPQEVDWQLLAGWALLALALLRLVRYWWQVASALVQQNKADALHDLGNSAGALGMALMVAWFVLLASAGRDSLAAQIVLALALAAFLLQPLWYLRSLLRQRLRPRLDGVAALSLISLSSSLIALALGESGIAWLATVGFLCVQSLYRLAVNRGYRQHETFGIFDVIVYIEGWILIVLLLNPLDASGLVSSMLLAALSPLWALIRLPLRQIQSFENRTAPNYQRNWRVSVLLLLGASYSLRSMAQAGDLFDAAVGTLGINAAFYFFLAMIPLFRTKWRGGE